MQKSLRFAYPIGAAALVVALAAHADPPSFQAPPKEAFDACATSKEGDSCTVKFRDMVITGTCASFPERGLFCRPAGPPPHP